MGDLSRSSWRVGLVLLLVFFATSSLSSNQTSSIFDNTTQCTSGDELTGLWRVIYCDWKEWSMVLFVAVVLWFASMREGQKEYRAPWKQDALNHIPVNGPNNKKNAMKITRYSSPFHLLVAVTVEYLIDNVYFIIVVLFQLFCDCSPTGKHSTYPGLILAWLGKLALTASEEYSLWRQQVQFNSRKHTVVQFGLLPSATPEMGSPGMPSPKLNSGGVVDSMKSGEIRAGRLVVVEDEGIVPVDGIILASSEEGNFPVLFNEAALTGETAPAAKFTLDIGERIDTNKNSLDDVCRIIATKLLHEGVIICASEPTPSSTSFSGQLINKRDEVIASFTHKNAAFRGSKLHGTKWVLILSVYTGHDTKEGLSFVKKTGVKITPLDSQLSFLIYRWNLPVIALLSLAATAHSVYLGHSGGFVEWLSTTSFADMLREITKQFIISFLFLNGLNNLSTKFMGDIVRIGQCRNMAADRYLNVETNRTIPDTLGCINVIITDKTGTITKNQLKLETIVVAQSTGNPKVYSVNNRQMLKEMEKHFGLSEESKALSQFLLWMATCNSVLPKNNSYFSSNPDELEFVTVAKNLNHELVSRFNEKGRDFVKVRLLDEKSIAFSKGFGNEEIRHDMIIEVLQTHEFSSARKYMTTILRPQGKHVSDQVWVVLKGADVVVRKKLSFKCPMRQSLSDIVAEYASEGKRVLVWAAKQITVDEYEQWSRKYMTMTSNNGSVSLPESAWEEIERELFCSGITVVSDKLQEGVETVINYARRCGISMVMATGDSVDTAEAIWRKLGQIHYRVERLVASEMLDKDNNLRVDLLEQQLEKFKQIKKEDRTVLIIDGDTLGMIKGRYRKMLSELMERFESVVAARMTARQKAEINAIYKARDHVTLAIGDGGNDITMIQQADVGVGIAGSETDAAGKAADFKIQEFRELQGLLVYGLQNYFRLSVVYLWNDYKAIVLATVPFISRWIRGFTGPSLIPGDMIFILTTVVLSLPVVLVGIYDVPFTVQELVRKAQHYNQHRHRRFDWRKKLLFWVSATLHSIVILIAVLAFFPNENPLVQGVLAGQMVGWISNVRLIFEVRNVFKLHYSWRLLLASFASAVLVIPVANLNPAADVSQRLKFVGSAYLPKLSATHVHAVIIVAIICFLLDLVVYVVSGEPFPWAHKLFGVKKKRNEVTDFSDDEESEKEKFD